MHYVILPLRRYFDFSGRSRRKEYWMYVLFTIIARAVLAVLDRTFGWTLGDVGSGRGSGVLGTIFSVATFVPSLSVGVRRLHDIDRTGWWLVAPLVAAFTAGFIGSALGGRYGARTLAMSAAVLGLVVMLVFFCSGGTRGPNRFGEDPKNPVSYDGVFD